jgi:predicted RNA-binding protein
MKTIFNITDSSDTDCLLVTIEANKLAKDTIKKVKAETEKLWYKNQDEAELLTKAEIGVIMETVNGDWVEIFEVLLKDNNVDYIVADVVEV